jgi:hypothetical protein
LEITLLDWTVKVPAADAVCEEGCEVEDPTDSTTTDGPPEDATVGAGRDELSVWLV